MSPGGRFGSLCSALVLCLIATGPAGTPAGAQAPTGVSGTVRVVTSPSRRLASAGAYPGRTVSVEDEHDVSELANVVVYVQAPPTPGRPMRAAIRQTNEEFVPHVVAVTTGSVVEFPNDDLLFHNVFSLSRTATFDLGRFPKGQSKSRTFNRAGLVKVYCHLHSHMSALVRVFDHPYFAIPSRDGRFTIEGLPPGRHTVVAWHERVGEVSSPVVIEAGRMTPVSFSLPLTDGD